MEGQWRLQCSRCRKMQRTSISHRLPANPFPLQGFPTWQVLLVDLRCHGDTAAAAAAPPAGPHTVDVAAADVLALLRARRMFPQMLIGVSCAAELGACPFTALLAQLGARGAGGSSGQATAGGGSKQATGKQRQTTAHKG